MHLPLLPAVQAVEVLVVDGELFKRAWLSLLVACFELMPNRLSSKSSSQPGILWMGVQELRLRSHYSQFYWAEEEPRFYSEDILLYLGLATEKRTYDHCI